MAVKALFFDYDNTLGNRTEYTYQTFLDAVEDSTPGMDPMERESILQDCMLWDQGGIIGRRYAQEKAEEKYGMKWACGDLQEFWYRDQIGNVLLFPDTLATLKELKKGYLLGIISDGRSDVQRGKLKACGILDLFDTVVISGDIGREKPAPEIFQKALDSLHVQAEESVYVGDIFLKDVIGAWRMGMKPIWICPQPKPYKAEITVIHRLSEMLAMFPERGKES